MNPQQNLSRPWRFEAKSNNSLEIFLYDDIGDSAWSDTGITARSFTDDLKKAGPISSIHLRVNSPGGAVFDGIAIYNALLNCGATVAAQVDGLAASIASVIIMAAEKISMAENAMLMIHNPHAVAGGDSTDHRRMAETMDKVRASMVTAYQRHSSLSAERISKMMDNETWLTAAEAIDQGFAEEITPEAEPLPIAASVNLTQFRNVPQVIAARLQRKPDPAPYVPQFSGRSLEEIDADQERLRLRRRLDNLKRN